MKGLLLLPELKLKTLLKSGHLQACKPCYYWI